MTHDTVDRVLAETGRARDDGSAGQVLSRLYRLMTHVDRRLARIFERHGLTQGEMGVLGALAHAPEPSLTPGRLAGLVLCSSGAMTNRLDRLEAEGLITRTPDPDDRRGSRVAITKAGRLRHRGAGAERERSVEELFPGLSETDRRKLVALLRKTLSAYESDTTG